MTKGLPEKSIQSHMRTLGLEARGGRAEKGLKVKSLGIGVHTPKEEANGTRGDHGPSHEGGDDR